MLNLHRFEAQQKEKENCDHTQNWHIDNPRDKNSFRLFSFRVVYVLPKYFFWLRSFCEFDFTSLLPKKLNCFCLLGLLKILDNFFLLLFSINDKDQFLTQGLIFFHQFSLQTLRLSQCIFSLFYLFFHLFNLVYSTWLLMVFQLRLQKVFQFLNKLLFFVLQLKIFIQGAYEY